MTIITCIANNGSNGEVEVPLWECPCAECTKLDWEALDDDDRPTLRQHRHGGFPECWDANGRAIPSIPQWSAFATPHSKAEAEAEREAFIAARVVIDPAGQARPVRTFPTAYDADCAAKGLGLHTLTADSAVDANGTTFVLSYIAVRSWGWVAS